MPRLSRNKYRVAPAAERRWNGRTYASKAEMERAQQLRQFMEAGEVIEIVEQPRLWLGVPENVYVPDFLVLWKYGGAEYEDVKGVETAQFRRVKKLWAAYGRLPLRIVKKSGQRFRTSEVIQGGASS